MQQLTNDTALSIIRPSSHEARRARRPSGAILERGGYSVRVGDPTCASGDSRILISRMYSWRGYCSSPTPSPASSHQILLEASNMGQVCGTLTVRLDSEAGLLADALYRREINAHRAEHRSLCEISQLAIDPERGSKDLLASLFHLAYIFARVINQASDALIEVNPRHAPFYVRRLGFKQIGDTRICQRVMAPAVLLHLELQYMEAQIARHAGSRNSTEKSLYPYFLSACEADEVLERVARAA